MNEALRKQIRSYLIRKRGTELTDEELDTIICMVGQEYYMQGFRVSGDAFNGQLSDELTDEELWAMLREGYTQLIQEPKIDF